MGLQRSMIWLRKAKRETRDKAVHHPRRNANPAIRMVNEQELAPQERLTNRFGSSSNRESVAKRRLSLFIGNLLNASTTAGNRHKGVPFF